MHVAIEATSAADLTASGIPRYTRKLAEALMLAAASPGAGLELTLLYRSSRWRLRHRLPQAAHVHRQMWRDSLWPIRKPYDVVHAPSYRLPDWRGVRKVSTICDIYAALGINFENPQDREREVATYRDLAARSDRIVFISRHTRDDFLRVIGYDEARAHVTHLGVGEEFRPQAESEMQRVRQKFDLREPFLFFIGLANPNKNLARLMDAYAQSRARADHQLVIAGKASADQEAALRARIETLGLAGRVRLLGPVPDADLPALYGAAAAFMFPSLYEGFGLPILESMASLTPVLTSSTTSCPEVAAGHAVLVDPQSPDEIARGIDRAIGMSPAQREAARQYAITKTWRQTAEETLAVYRLACGA